MKQCQQPHPVPSTPKLPTAAAVKAPPTVLSEAQLKQVAGGVRTIATQTPTKGW